jgi:exosortase
MGGPNLDQHGAGRGPAGPPWRRILLGALGVALALLAWRQLLGFGLEPEDASLSHGLENWFFIPSQSIAAAVLAMSLWLLFRRRRALRELPPAPGAAWVGAVLLAGAGAVHVWATRAAASDLLVPSLMLAALAAAWLWKGAPAVRAVLLPVGMLLFAMPLPAPLLNELIYRLQLWTAQLAGFALELANVPHVVMGEEIQRAQQTFSVIETCSGLRSMETLSQVAILMMDLFRRRGVHAVLVVLAAPPVAFALNGLRALLLILSPHSEIAAIHNLQGIAILLAGLVVLFLVDGLLERADRGRAAPEAAPATSPAPARHTPASTRTRSAAALGWLAAAAAVSLWLPPWQVPSHEAAGLAERLGLEVGGAPELPTDRIFLGNAGFRESFTRRFDDHGDPVTLFLGMGDRAARERSAWERVGNRGRGLDRPARRPPRPRAAHALGQSMAARLPLVRECTRVASRGPAQSPGPGPQPLAQPARDPGGADRDAGSRTAPRGTRPRAAGARAILRAAATTTRWREGREAEEKFFPI